MVLDLIKSDVKKWKGLIIYFEKNRDEKKYKHGEWEKIEALCDYINKGDFDPNKKTALLQKDGGLADVFQWSENRQGKTFENFKSFSELCNNYLFDDEEVFYAFQAELTNIKQIDDASLEQIYREVTGSFDANKFILCKKILKGIQQKNQPLVWEYYYNTEGDLVNAGVQNRPIAKEILVRFCTEINLEYKPCTLEELEKWKKQKASYNIQLKETIEKLEDFFEEKDVELDYFEGKIDEILSSIKDSNEYKEKYIDKLTNSTKSFYQDEEKINQLRGNKDELQKVKQKIEKLRKSVLDLKKHIADKIKEVETAVGGEKLSNITDSNVIAMFGKVTKEYESVIQKYDEENDANIDEYNADIKRFNMLVEQFDKLTDEIDKERKKKDDDLDKKIKTLKYDYLKLRNKPFAKIFVLLQTAMLVVSSFSVYKLEVNSGYALILVNILLLIWCIRSESRRFNKINETVYELKSYIVNSFTYRKKNAEGQTETVTVNVEDFTRLKLFGYIILSCMFFVFFNTLILLITL